MYTISMKDCSEYSHLNESRIEEKFHDVVIRVGDRSFPCHRVILASTMKYFRNMFSGNYGVEAEKKEVEVKCVNADDFELLLTYVYGGSVSVSGNSILRLFKISHYMGPQSLEDACTELIVQNISTFSLDSALSIFMFACKRQNNFTLTEGLMKWAAENFAHLAEREEFLPISGFDLQKILIASHFEMDSNMILDFLFNWAKYHTEDERKLLPELLNVVKIEEAPIEWILKMLMNCAAQPNPFELGEEDDLLPVTVESLMEMDMNEGINETEPELPFLLVCRVTPSANVQNDVCVLRYGTQNDVKFVDSYSSKMKYDDVSFKCKLVFLGDLQLTVFSTFTVDDEKDYYYRYTTKLFASNHFKKKDFSFSTHNGDVVSSLSIPNHNGYQKDAHLTVATIDSNIFLYNNVQFIVCNCERNDWFNVPTRNFEKTISPNLLSLNNSLYMIGGKYFKDSYFGCRLTLDNKLEFSDATVRERIATDGKIFQRYDLREGKWTRLPPMNYARSRSASCVYKDTVYVTGGDNLAYYRNYNAEYFDTRTNKWNVIAAPMPKSKMNHSVVVHNDHLWFFGGENAGPSLEDDLTMFSYDLKENIWSDVLPLPKSYGKLYSIKQILDVVAKV